MYLTVQLKALLITYRVEHEHTHVGSEWESTIFITNSTTCVGLYFVSVKKKNMISLCGLKWKATRKNIALRNETLCTDALDRAGLDFQVIQKTMHSFVVGILYWWLFKIQTDAINYL